MIMYLSILYISPFFPIALSQTNYAQYVNPFIGSEGPYPGKSMLALLFPSQSY